MHGEMGNLINSQIIKGVRLEELEIKEENLKGRLAFIQACLSQLDFL